MFVQQCNCAAFAVAVLRTAACIEQLALWVHMHECHDRTCCSCSWIAERCTQVSRKGICMAQNLPVATLLPALCSRTLEVTFGIVAGCAASISNTCRIPSVELARAPKPATHPPAGVHMQSCRALGTYLLVTSFVLHRMYLVVRCCAMCSRILY